MGTPAVQRSSSETVLGDATSNALVTSSVLLLVAMPFAPSSVAACLGEKEHDKKCPKLGAKIPVSMP